MVVVFRDVKLEFFVVLVVFEGWVFLVRFGRGVVMGLVGLLVMVCMFLVF